MAKRFGGNRRRADAEDIELVVLREEQEEIHKFKILPRVSAGDVLALMQAMSGGRIEGAARIGGLLRRAMANGDGLTPHGWTAVELPRAWREGPSGAVQPLPSEDDLAEMLPEDRTEIEHATLPRSYRGPDGEIYPFSDEAALAKFSDPINGSSRRRWVHLLDHDEEATVDMADLMEIAEYVIEKASDRPT